jgi:hypothetical protein
MNQGVVHPLDKLIDDDSLIMLEAMVPFIDYRFKKLLVIYIKYREFTLIMNNLNDIGYADRCGFNKKAATADDMMEVILSTMSPETAANISNAKKMMTMMQAAEAVKDFPADAPESKPCKPEGGTPDKSSLFDSILNIIENESES